MSSGGSYRVQHIISNIKPGHVPIASFQRGISTFNPVPGINLSRVAVLDFQHVFFNPGARTLEAQVPASDGLLFGTAPDLGYDLSISLDDFVLAHCGSFPTVQGSHSSYPALEVWLYEDGQRPTRLYYYEPSRYGNGIMSIVETTWIGR